MLRQFIALVLISASAALLALALRQAPSSKRTLMVYCAAGMKQPVEHIAHQYEKETGARIELQFGGTGTLLSQLRIAKKGDLFIAADEDSFEEAKKLGVIEESLS